MTCEVIGEAKGNLDIKRLHLPGVKITGICEYCGNPVMLDLGKYDSISNPSVGKDYPNIEWFYCDECDENTELKIQLEVKVTVL